MTETVQALIEAVRREAERIAFPIDVEVYQRQGRDPRAPILFAGSLEARVCIVGRDLGKDEVRAGEPLIGAAGRAVRVGIIRARIKKNLEDGNESNETTALAEALEHALLTNLVPYKPCGNKAYSNEVRRRFRPFLESLLVDHWQGDRVITLGAQAFEWFKPYADSAAFDEHGRTPDRFEKTFRCQIRGNEHNRCRNEKTVWVYPLPHPSPLNRRWFSRFPSMLATRLADIWT